MYSPVHVHSEYSKLDGLSTTKEIAKRCQDIGCECCGISDHGTVAGHLDFAKVMAENKIKPIFACELYHGVKTSFKPHERDQAHFLAGAMTDEGLRNLWRLVDASSENFRFVGRVNWTMLEKFKEGMFATSACMNGLVPKGLLIDDYEALNHYLEIYRDNFYLELHAYPTEEQRLINKRLVEVGEERGIPLICSTDAHFADPDQYEIHDAYTAIAVGDRVDAPDQDRKMKHPKSLYIQTEEEIRTNLEYLDDSTVSQAFANSEDLGRKVNASLPEVKRHLPVFVPSDSPWVNEDRKNDEADKLLMDLVQEGLEHRYPDSKEKVWDRAASELKVILDAGLEHYFLQAWDLCQFCDKENIQRGPGRGSAAGAIVAYALGITDIDPLKYDLIFERFYNAGRESGYPDIDTDFPVAERKTIRKYLIKRWGKDKVRTIGTTARMKPKGACDKTYAAFGVTWGEKESLKKILDFVPDLEILGSDSIGWARETDPGKVIYVMDHIGDELETWLVKLGQSRRVVIERWIKFLEVVCSRVNNYGVHPSGIVVSDIPLADQLPCRWSTDQKIPVTIFPMKDVDKRMFVKQDVLGLRNLDTLQDWEGQVGSIKWSGLEEGDHPDEMWEMLDKGLSLGVFQIEEGFARRLCKDFKPRSIDDLAIIVSLNRPGPIRSGAPDSFVKRRFGEEEVSYDHPILESILEPTYGWFLYQEQVIAFFSKIGYDLLQADAVRSILGKKKPQEMKKLRNGEGEWKGFGYFSMAEKAGIDATSAAKIWERLEDFSKYSFNKSHAEAYATLAFRTLYAKYKDPSAFIIACIRTNPKKAGAYVSEGRRMGIKVLPPDIEVSGAKIKSHEGDIYFGFSNIKGIGVDGANYLAELRDTYDITSPEKLHNALSAESATWNSEDKATRGKSPKQRCRANFATLLFDIGAWDKFEERNLSDQERQDHEKELLQVVLTDTSTELFAKVNNAPLLNECDSYDDLEGVGGFALIPGVVTHLKETFTKKGNKAMGIVTVEYEGDEAEFVVFPDHWKGWKFLWKERTCAIFHLTRGERGLAFKEAMKLT